MAKIQFRAKAQSIYWSDNTLKYRFVVMPELKRSHCDMEAFIRHPKYGGLANSDIFPDLLKRISRQLVIPDTRHMRIDNLPDNVTVDTSGFLALVTIEV